MATFFDPLDTLLQFQQALDSFRTSGWLAAGPSAGGGYPPINIFRKGDDVVAIAEVPGISKADLGDPSARQNRSPRRPQNR